MLRDLLDSSGNWDVLDIPYVGVLGSDVPLTGDHGASALANDDIFSYKRYRIYATGPPSSGTTFLNMDGSGYHTPAAGEVVSVLPVDVFEDGYLIGSTTLTFLNGVSQGPGDLRASPAMFAGQGVAFTVGALTGTGDIAAGSASVSGAGFNVLMGTGAIVASRASIQSAPPAAVTGTGALLAASAQISNQIPATGTCDASEIADAVYAKLVAEGVIDKINDIWTLMGLDPANPLTVTPTTQDAGHVDINMTSTGAGPNEVVTATRQ